MTHPRRRIEPIDIMTLPRTDRPDGGYNLRIDEYAATGGFTGILKMPENKLSPNADKGFEYHTGHEEIFILEGLMHFHDHYDWPSLGYLNHPPYWIHPANQHTESGCRMLVKISTAVDFVFKPIPEGWAGDEYIDLDSARVPPGRGISNLRLDDLPWEPVQRADGTPAGYDAKRIYEDPNTGWTTWLMRVPAGWRDDRPRRELAGGEEIFVIEGDITLDGTRYTANWYSCDPARIVNGAASSEVGCLAIRWTIDADHLRLPPLRF